MDLFVYADESGVFDPRHGDYFVFGGVILLGAEEVSEASRRYAAAEEKLRPIYEEAGHDELKATYLSAKHKGSLFRSLNRFHRFGVIIDLKRVYDRILTSKKDKQRYLDYVFKIAVKRALVQLIAEGSIKKREVGSIFVYMDEHSTATNGRYEMEEGLESEFKTGVISQTFTHRFQPLFPDMKKVRFKLIDSKHASLIRAADITANRLYHEATLTGTKTRDDKIFFITQP